MNKKNIEKEAQKYTSRLIVRLTPQLSRVYFWQKIVRILSIIVYLFVFCWMMFVLFGGYLVGYIGLENYSVVTQYIFPVFMGFIVLNFAFSRSLMKFQGDRKSTRLNSSHSH